MLAEHFSKMWWAYVVIVVMIMLSAYFSASEIAFNSANKMRLRRTAEGGSKTAKIAFAISEKFTMALSAILIGNNIVNILSASLATILFINLIGDIGTPVSTIVMTLLVLVFGEICPKTIAKKKPEAFVLFSAPIIKAIMVILFPLTFIFKKLQNSVRCIF